LRRSVALLGGGVASGLVGGIAAAKLAILGTIELSTSTFGAGMVVGARIGLAAVTGAAIVDMSLIALRAVARWRETAGRPDATGADVEGQGWRRVHTVRLVIWSL